MKDNEVLVAAMELKEFNEKAAGSVTRELKIIEESLANNPDKLQANAARLNSLCEHISLTFKQSLAEKVAAKVLISLIKHKIDKLLSTLKG